MDGRVPAQGLLLDWALLAFALAERYPQRRPHQICGDIGLCMPGYDALREHVDDERDVGEAGPRSDVSEVSDRAVIALDVAGGTASSACVQFASEGVVEDAVAIARAVVGQDAAHGNAGIVEEGVGPLPEYSGGVLA